MKKEHLPKVFDAVVIITLCIAIGHNVSLVIKCIEPLNQMGLYAHGLVVVLYLFILIGYLWIRNLQMNIDSLKRVREVDLRMIIFLQENVEFYKRQGEKDRGTVIELKRERMHLIEKLSIYQAAEKKVIKKKNVTSKDKAAE